MFDVNTFTDPMKLLLRSFRLAVVAIAVGRVLVAMGPDPAALEAWDEYIKAADSEVGKRIATGRPFLRLDDSPKEQKQLQMGEIPVVPRVGHGMLSVPRALIHDWAGSVFIPDATLDRVLAVALDYVNYKDLYKSIVASSKLVRCSPAEQEFSMVWRHHALFQTVAIASELKSHNYDLGNGKWYTVAWATQLQEIADFGKRSERFLPPDQRNGFLWRVYSITKYEQRDGGTYVELEGMALSRDIPVGMRWLVKPIVEQLSRISIAMFLRRIRDAAIGNAVPARRWDSCPTTTPYAKQN